MAFRIQAVRISGFAVKPLDPERLNFFRSLAYGIRGSGPKSLLQQVLRRSLKFGFRVSGS